MKRLPLALSTFRLKNFKAVCDSRTVRFAPLTVFIGNNGSGKSSIVEGLETFQAIVEYGLDKAMQPWRGFEHIWNQASQRGLSDAMAFELAGRTNNAAFRAQMSVYADSARNRVYILHERLDAGDGTGFSVVRDADGQVTLTWDQGDAVYRITPGRSSLRGTAIEERVAKWNFANEWQFVSLVPQVMGTPMPQSRSAGEIKLARDGSNIAEYLWSIRQLDHAAFDGILDALRYVLPYAADVQPVITSELERAVYLQMTEGQFKVPGWLLSTGTLRIVALLALLRHPKPPPLIIIEEIENGLDPRTVNMLVQELQAATEAGIQVIATTHSPYLLDALPLDSVVLVDRVDDQPIFSRPADDKEVRAWAKEFTTGRLYTMSRLNTRKMP